MYKIREKVMDEAAKKVVEAMRLWEEFKNEEKGASEMVAVVALIVIILAVAIIFKNQLINIVNAVGNKVISWIG